MRAVGENETMMMSRRQHSGDFKAKVVLEALRGERTINELAVVREAVKGIDVPISQWN